MKIKTLLVLIILLSLADLSISTAKEYSLGLQVTWRTRYSN